MRRVCLALPLALTCTAQITQAAPCVSATFDKPLEGASSVITRQVDVPSPQFPGLWQEGILNGYFYAIYANGEAEVKAARSAQDWMLRVSCQTAADGCDRSQTGTPPEDAVATLLVLQQCLGGTLAPGPAPPPEEPTAPCGLQTVPQGPDGERLQNLLVAAGSDPGPVDGLIGAKTLDALALVLGASARSLGVQEALAALDVFLCDAAD